MEVVAGETVVVETTVVVGVAAVVEVTVVVGKSDVLVGVSVSEAPPQAEANRSKQTTIPTFFMLKVCHRSIKIVILATTICVIHIRAFATSSSLTNKYAAKKEN